MCKHVCLVSYSLIFWNDMNFVVYDEQFHFDFNTHSRLNLQTNYSLHISRI